MNRSRSKKGKNSQIPLFITKLLEMVENIQIQQTIGWTSTGDSFSIKNVSKFTEQVLPRYFKHRNFSSFIRQLNMYGFRKTRHSDGDNIYMHDYFKFGNRAQLRLITRKMRQQKEDQIVVYQPHVKSDPASTKQIQELKTKQKNLQQMCRDFLSQNQRLMQQNQNLIRKMQFQAKERERRLQNFLIALSQRKSQPQILDNQPCLSITQDILQSPNGLFAPIDIENNRAPPETEHFKRVRSLLQQLYEANLEQKNLYNPKREQGKSQGLGFEQDDNSYMSINDFINADDYDNQINLEQSN